MLTIMVCAVLRFLPFISRHPFLDQLPSMPALDTLLAIFVGVVILALSKLYSISFWGFIAFIITVAVLILIGRIDHQGKVPLICRVVSNPRSYPFDK